MKKLWACRRSVLQLMTLAACFGTTSQVAAFQILPKVSDVDRELHAAGDDRAWNFLGSMAVNIAVPLVKAPVHESITLAAFGCPAPAGKEVQCVTAERVLEHRMVLYGVRWPDDPPFRLSAINPPKAAGCDVRVTLRSTAQPKCWKALFDDAGKRASQHKGEGPAFGIGTMVLYRSHYGDLQFMHAMASSNGETAGVTRQNMWWWAHFLWEMAAGRLATDVYLRDLNMPELARYFPGDITAQILFATGVPEARAHLREVALGVLLHMVQDSFSAAHAARDLAGGEVCRGYTTALAPGRVEAFHSYAQQRSKLHDKEDTAASLSIQTIEQRPTVVDASRTLIEAWRAKESWETVSPYIGCLLAVSDPATQAGPGPYR